MLIQLILAACLLSPILASPIPEDTCDAEMKKMEECFQKYDTHGAPDWWDDSFLDKPFPLQAWKDCVGEVKCERVKKQMEVDEMKYNVFVYFHINLRRCLNATGQHIWDTCETPEQWKLPCEDRTDFDCMEGKIMQHEHCNAQDVEAFNDFVPFLIRYRNLFEEVVHGGRKCEGTMDGYDKAEIPKLVSRVALSSFFDVVREIFTR